MTSVKRPIGNPQLLKELNSNHVFDLLVQEGRLSRAKLAQLTGLSRATISLLVDEIISGIIHNGHLLRGANSSAGELAFPCGRCAPVAPRYWFYSGRCVT